MIRIAIRDRKGRRAAHTCPRGAILLKPAPSDREAAKA